MVCKAVRGLKASAYLKGYIKEEYYQCAVVNILIDKNLKLLREATDDKSVRDEVLSLCDLQKVFPFGKFKTCLKIDEVAKEFDLSEEDIVGFILSDFPEILHITEEQVKEFLTYNHIDFSSCVPTESLEEQLSESVEKENGEKDIFTIISYDLYKINPKVGYKLGHSIVSIENNGRECQVEVVWILADRNHISLSYKEGTIWELSEESRQSFESWFIMYVALKECLDE